MQFSCLQVDFALAFIQQTCFSCMKIDLRFVIYNSCFTSPFITKQTNYELKSELDDSKLDLNESKGYLTEVQGQIKKEKRERAQ